MTQLDTVLDSLRGAPAPDALGAIEPGAFAGIAQQRERTVEAAALLGVSRKTIETRINRARQKLSSLVEG